MFVKALLWIWLYHDSWRTNASLCYESVLLSVNFDSRLANIWRDSHDTYAIYIPHNRRVFGLSVKIICEQISSNDRRLIQLISDRFSCNLVLIVLSAIINVFCMFLLRYIVLKGNRSDIIPVLKRYPSLPTHLNYVRYVSYITQIERTKVNSKIFNLHSISFPFLQQR